MQVTSLRRPSHPVAAPDDGVAQTLRMQTARAISRMDAGSMPPHVQRAIDKVLTQILTANPTATYDDDHYARVLRSETDKRTAGYALFLHETDAAGKESVIVVGFDLSGARVFRGRVSI